jgi:hypothetical protein
VNDTDVLRAVSDDQIDTALDRWKKVDYGARRAIRTGRELALAGGVLDAETLLGLRRAIEAGSSAVMEIASLVARALITRDEAAFSLIRDLAASSAAQGRIGALLCLPSRTRDVLTRPVLDALLRDRSKKVREMTVDWIRRNNLEQHLPMLEALLAKESDQPFKDFLAREIGLLKDGYYIHRERGSIYVTIKTMDGSYGGFIDLRVVGELSDQEIAGKFVSMNA